MPIHRVIVHQLDKNQGERQVNLQLRAEELTADARVERLVDQIRKIYNSRSGRGYGRFEPNRFLTVALRARADRETEFVEFTHRCMGELSSHMKQASLSTGGYVLFIEYDDHGSEYLMIVMLKAKPGTSFDSALEILDVQHLDLDRLHFAARVNLTAWEAESDRYISFVKGRSTSEVAVYFREFIGVEEYVEGREETKRLVGVINEYCGERGLSDDEADDLRRRVHAYCTNKARTGAPIILEDLSSFVNEDEPSQFLELANQRELSDEIEVSPAALKALVRYSGQDREVFVSFTTSAYEKRVFYNAEGNILTISPAPAALRRQLIEIEDD